MEKYIEIIMGLLQIPTVKAILFVIISFVTAKLADWIIRSVLKKLVNRTNTTIDDKIIHLLHRPIYYSILFLGLGISVNLIQFPEVINSILLGLFKTIVVIIWSTTLFHSFLHFINWYSKQDNETAILQSHTLPLFDNIGKVAIFMLATYCILISWKIDVTGIIFPTSILAVIIGFAAKDTVANIFAGLFIMTDNPYKPGDYINLDGGERGYVKTIGLRSTRIMTRDDIEITVPNALIANSKIINESGGDIEHERIRITVSVAYGTDIDKARKILMKIAESHGHVCKKPNPRVRFRSFGESGLIFQLLFWIKKPADRGRITDEINSSIYKEFMDQKIVIPYPQRTIHINNSTSLKNTID